MNAVALATNVPTALKYLARVDATAQTVHFPPRGRDDAMVTPSETAGPSEDHQSRSRADGIE